MAYQAYLLEDKQKNFNFKEILLHPEDYPFSQVNNVRHLNLGFSNSKYWILFLIQNDNKAIFKGKIELNNPFIEKVNIFIYNFT
ncbi:MAG: hypothetical protein KDK45_25885, partial [Leptospiraceae bacterium]|nr:hypothetical protein [Leptospiraceae bacterium]